MTSMVPPSGWRNGVVPVAADLRRARGSGVADDHLDVVRLRRRGEQAALQLLGELALLGEQPGVVERERARAATSRAVAISLSSYGRPDGPLKMLSSPTVRPRACIGRMARTTARGAAAGRAPRRARRRRPAGGSRPR
jgi:hypothetical protein